MIRACCVPLLAALSVPVQVIGAVNLVADAQVSADPLALEYRHWHEQGVATLSVFEEPSTWNRCLKLQIDGFADGKDGRTISTALLVGGTDKPGFPVEGGEKLVYSFDVRGTASSAVCLFKVWDKDGNTRHFTTQLNRFSSGDKWVPRKGEIEVPDDAIRGALAIQFWWDEKFGKMPYKVGDYLLVDNISISRKSAGREIWPKRAVVVPDGKSVKVERFLTANRNVEDEATTEVSISQDERALKLDFKMLRIDAQESYAGKGGAAIWKDDHVEVLLDNGGKRSHFAVSAGGGRWKAGSSENAADYDEWTADVVRKKGAWRARVEIPWKTMGFAERPEAGHPIPFQLARTRDLGPTSDKSQAKKATSTGFNRWYCDSSWSFVNNGFGDVTQWGVLFVRSMQAFADREKVRLKTDEAREKLAHVDLASPTAAWREIAALAEKDRMDFLAKQPFAVAQVRPSVNPELPFLPDELTDPQPKFSVRAAVNEYAVLPVALANMTDTGEDYRIVLTSGWARKEVPRHEQPLPVCGLRSEDGDILGVRNYRIRRGLRFRDSDASEHGRRYDALVSLGDGNSVTVASKDAALVWLSFDCRGVKPGVYRGVLEITPLSGGRKTKIESDGTRGFVVHDDSKSVPVELTVRTFALPDSPFGFNGYARIVEQQTLDWLDSVGVRPTHVMLTPWHFECDFNSDGAIVKRRLREYAVPEVRFYAKNIAKVPGLPRVMVGYSAYEHYREQISRKAPFRRGSDEYWRGYREWMKYIDDVVTSNGIARDDYTVEVFDEPSRARVPDDNEVRRALQETHMAVKGISVMITSGAPYYELIKDDVDDWVYYAGYTTLYSKAKAWATASRRVSVYQCDVGIRQENHRNYRVLPWRALAVGGNYVSLFQLVSQCPGTDFRTATFGEIVLRGEKATISTIRAENFVLGLTDVRYVKLLETLAERKPEKRESVRRFLDQTVHDIVFTYPHDPEKAEIFREEASRMIMELK